LRRNTAQRLALQQVFRRHDRPMAVDEILAHGRELVESLNQATVYRNLKILINSGWLRRFAHPETGTLYERTDKGHHHHYFCRSCKRAFDAPGCPLKEEGTAPEGFVIEEHEVFFFGVCSSCARESPNLLGP
jgi:Fur family ferric uptake transcriptional regulator